MNNTIYIKDNCNIQSIYNEGSNLCTGIESSSNVTFAGDGVLTVESKVSESSVNSNFTALSVGGNVVLSSGTHNFIGGVGIKTTGKLSINDTTTLIKGINQAISTNGDNSASGTLSTSYYDIHGNVMASTDYTGTGAVQNKKINHTELVTCKGYRYAKISPSIISVDIIWGNMIFALKNTWDPSTHEYYYEIDAEDGAGTISVSNTAESNVPIITNYSYTENQGYTDISGEISTTGGEMIENMGHKVDNGSTMTATLKLNHSGNELNYDFSTVPTVGEICVTLSEY